MGLYNKEHTLTYMTRFVMQETVYDLSFYVYKYMWISSDFLAG